MVEKRGGRHEIKVARIKPEEMPGPSSAATERVLQIWKGTAAPTLQPDETQGVRNSILQHTDEVLNMLGTPSQTSFNKKLNLYRSDSTPDGLRIGIAFAVDAVIEEMGNDAIPHARARALVTSDIRSKPFHDFLYMYLKLAEDARTGVSQPLKTDQEKFSPVTSVSLKLARLSGLPEADIKEGMEVTLAVLDRYWSDIYETDKPLKPKN